MTKHFDELGLSELALAAVCDLGYIDPTPVQEQAIPAVLAGRDVIAAAKTGTGKTAAFSLPSMDKLGHARHGQGPLMLVVTPTRELAMQIEEVCTAIAKETHHQVSKVIGGVAYGPQIDALAKGTDVLIATPGRLVDLIKQDAAHLGQVETLVLDEADRMLDMGFLPDMKRIVTQCPDDRQTLLFSATIDDGIERNMKDLLHDPVFVEIAHKGETADTVDQYIVRVAQRQKNDLLISLLKEQGGTRIIVFARTRHRVDNCVRKLRRAGFKCEPIHSDRRQNQRKRALDAFAAGRCDILVATDVLARGIDVSDVNYVVNLDLPEQAEDYVHRIGRTGRAGEEGFAVSFVSPETENLLRDIEKLIGKKIPVMEVKSFDASESDVALAKNATRKNAQDDPELTDAAKEFESHKASKKKKQQKCDQDQAGEREDRDERADRGSKKQRKNRRPQPQKTRGTAQKQGKKNQKGAEGRGQGGRKGQNQGKRGGKGSRNSRGKGQNQGAAHNEWGGTEFNTYRKPHKQSVNGGGSKSGARPGRGARKDRTNRGGNHGGGNRSNRPGRGNRR
jgi:ATP-dependent RNA helicase RhlE